VQVGCSAKEPSVAQYIAREAEGEPDVEQVISRVKGVLSVGVRLIRGKHGSAGHCTGRAGQVAHVSLGMVRVGKHVVAP